MIMSVRAANTEYTRVMNLFNQYNRRFDPTVDPFQYYKTIIKI